jgi:hypothetical protein
MAGTSPAMTSLVPDSGFRRNDEALTCVNACASDCALNEWGAAAGGNQPMPLTSYEAFFPAAELVILSDAFDLAWQKLAASLGATKGEEEILALRAKLAECIIISAMEVAHERPENVAEEALRCLHENHFTEHGVPLI